MERISSQPEDFRREALMVKAALKSGQEKEKGIEGEYFADHEYLLDDDEIMAVVANRYPYVLGHLLEKSQEKDFVIKWLTNIGNQDVDEVYRDARKNAMTVMLSSEEIEQIKNSRK